MKPNLTCRIKRKLLVFPCSKIPHFIFRLLGLHSTAQNCKSETNMKSGEDNMERIACTSTRHQYIFGGGFLRYVFYPVIPSQEVFGCFKFKQEEKQLFDKSI